MKHTRIITAITSHLRLPAAFLENLVNLRTKKTKYNYPVTGIEKNLSGSDFDIVSTYSIQTFVKGDLKLECYNNSSAMIETIRVPVGSCFLVTCIKANEDGYRVEFSASLN